MYLSKFVFKITVIGDPAVGKTSLIKKYTQGGFQEDYIKTIGAQFSKYDEMVNGENCRLFFWDIAGQDTFYFLRPAFYSGSSASIIVFSLEDTDQGKKSFENVKNWYNDFKDNCGDLPVVLFGNKVDLVDEKTLNDEKVLNLVDKCGIIGYYKTSAKTGDGVNKAFHAIINGLYHKFKKK